MGWPPGEALTAAPVAAAVAGAQATVLGGWATVMKLAAANAEESLVHVASCGCGGWHQQWLGSWAGVRQPNVRPPKFMPSSTLVLATVTHFAGGGRCCLGNRTSFNCQCTIGASDARGAAEGTAESLEQPGGAAHSRRLPAISVGAAVSGNALVSAILRLIE